MKYFAAIASVFAIVGCISQKQTHPLAGSWNIFGESGEPVAQLQFVEEGYMQWATTDGELMQRIPCRTTVEVFLEDRVYAEGHWQLWQAESSEALPLPVFANWIVVNDMLRLDGVNAQEDITYAYWLQRVD